MHLREVPCDDPSVSPSGSPSQGYIRLQLHQSKHPGRLLRGLPNDHIIVNFDDVQG